MTRLLGTVVVLASWAIAGCASVPPDAGFEDVRQWTSERLGKELVWRPNPADAARIDADVERLLREPLTPDGAVRVALLRNRSIQAELEHLGIATADLAQAGLLSNPALSARVRLPDGDPSRANVELGVVQDLLHVLMLPERRRIAEHRLASTKLSVAASIVEFAADVERAYFEALGAAQAASVRRLVVDAASTSAELARRLHEAGNISDLALATELGLYEGVRVAWARTESARAAARDELNRLLGLWGPAAAWTLPTGLPDLPAEEPRLGPVEAEAIANRLDLEAAIAESQAIAREAGVTRAWSFLPAVELGASAEREPDGSWVLGPELGLELPIFDRGQADLVRLDAELRRADQRVFGLAVEIRSEARAARDRLLEARWLVEHYRDVLIPVREATVAALQEEHAFMLAGTFELIAAKQAEYDAYQEYVEAVRDYWLARVRLDRALGGRARTTPHPQASDPLPIAPARRDPHPNHEHGGH